MIKNLFYPLLLSIVIVIPVCLFFNNLPIKVWQWPKPAELPVLYWNNEPLTVDLAKSKINVEDYIKTLTTTTLSKSELRKSLQIYLEPKLYMFHRTPSEGSNYSTEWHYVS